MGAAPTVGRRFCNIRLGGMYSFFAFVSPSSDPSLDRVPAPALRLPLMSLLRTLSTIAFLTPFFAISFFKSARAASVTPGPVKSSMIEGVAQARTLPSVSSKASTRSERYGLMGNV